MLGCLSEIHPVQNLHTVFQAGHLWTIRLKRLDILIQIHHIAHEHWTLHYGERLVGNASLSLHNRLAVRDVAAAFGIRERTIVLYFRAAPELLIKSFVCAILMDFAMVCPISVSR